ncbi:MAG: insulinase family protein, partial [Candidatus Krumholzibacteria bacterium]|nr:insulinase family protein [Candidatus Krumholzibacteria bacterium]
FVTRSDDEQDHLAVGFRLPYGTPEEATIVHLTETIMEQENGNPILWIFDDEALLIIHVEGRWSTHRTDQEAANKASEQFYDEVRTVYHRVRDSWFFERNRKTHVKELRERLSLPHPRAVWRAQSLADDRELPDIDLMAAMVDSLDHEKIRKFFAEQFTPSRAFMAFAAGHPPKNTQLFLWNRFLRIRINPYLIDYAETTGLGVADIEPVLSEVESIGGMESLVLSNGIPVHIHTLPGANEVYIGGVRTFDALSEEARSRSPGRLILYQVLANTGYDYKGSRIAPKGEGPGWNTWIDASVNSLKITAHGPTEKFEDVSAAMHKRIDVDHLNPFAFTWLAEDSREMVRQYHHFPAIKSYSWLLGTVFGPDHPIAGWVCPDTESITDWSVKGANKLHRKLCRTGNFQIVVTGDVDRETIQEILDDNFGRNDKAEPGPHPVSPDRKIDVVGHVVHDSTSTVAFVEFMFPPSPTTVSPPLGMIDLLVLERLFERRLQVAVHLADLDSVSVQVWIQPVGAAALPRIQIINRPEDTAKVIELVREVTARIRDEAPTPAEEALARIQLLGAFVESLLDPQESRNLLLGLGLSGVIPDNPLAQLCRREYGVVARQAERLFPHNQHAWAVTGDTTLTAIREIISTTR